MTECNHEWIRLTSVVLELHLLPESYGTNSISGCKLCGAIMNHSGEIFLGPASNEQIYTNNKIKQYWNALARFGGR